MFLKTFNFVSKISQWDCHRKLITATSLNLFSCMIRYEQFRRSSNYRLIYSLEVEKVINDQIKIEQQAAQEYLNLAVYFLNTGVSRPGMGAFFMKMHKEELEHMYQLINYQLSRGAAVQVSCIDAPQISEELTLKSAFEKALMMEKSVTKTLQEAVQIALNVKDYHCEEFITRKFLSEQFKSINELSHHITNLSRLTDEASIYIYDQALSKNYPWKV